MSQHNKQCVTEKTWGRENTAFLHERLVGTNQQERHVFASKVILHHHVHRTCFQRQIHVTIYFPTVIFETEI
jgi:hypothetical protein